MKLDGKRYDRNFIRWSDLVKGAKIDIFRPIFKTESQILLTNYRHSSRLSE